MAQALIGSHQSDTQVYQIPLLRFEINAHRLRITRCALMALVGLGFLSGITLGFRQCAFHSSPLEWVYPLVISITLIAGVLLIKSYYLEAKEKEEDRPLKSHQFSKGYTLEKINSQSELIDELFEPCKDGMLRVCSFSRVKEIVSELSENKTLFLLNAIPPSLNQGFTGYNPLKYTSLHYWAMKGDLQVVSFLLDNGAHDNFTKGDQLNTLASGLFLAALNGHVEIVNLLIHRGSKIDVAFSGNNVLHSFIPRLIFELEAKLENISSDKMTHVMSALRIILNQLKIERPDHLDFQLKIPIIEGVNCLKWLSENESDSIEEVTPAIKTLEELLIEFGADAANVFSFHELEAMSCNINNKYTLYVANTVK